MADLRRATHAVVTVWPRADATDGPVSAESVLDSIQGITAERVLVVAGPEGVRAIPLAQ